MCKLLQNASLLQYAIENTPTLSSFLANRKVEHNIPYESKKKKKLTFKFLYGGLSIL